MSELATEPVVRALEVACPSCGSVFPVDPLRIPPQGILTICSACLRTFPILRPEGLPVAAVVPVPAPAGGGAARETTEEVITEAVVREEVTEEVVLETVVEEAVDVASEKTPSDAPADEPAKEEPVGASPAGTDASEATPDPAISAWDAPPGASTSAPAAPPPPTSDPVAPPAGGDPVPPPPTRTPAPGVSSGIGGGGRSGLAAGAARFGSRDPSERARRLARVLASDMITYNPARYADARKGGTLVEDFREEIEKSWEEYVDQVGAELASSTDYFVDALNEVLARGETLFQGPGYPYDDPPG